MGDMLRDNYLKGGKRIYQHQVHGMKEESLRRLNYLGCRIKFPRKHKYIATDNDGKVYAFDSKPKRYGGVWNNRGDAMCIGSWVDEDGRHLSPPCTFYKNSMIRVDDISVFERFRQWIVTGIKRMTHD